MPEMRQQSFTCRVVLALILGFIFGAVLQLIFGYTSQVIQSSMDWGSVVGSGYVRLLRRIVFPLFFLSILYAVVTPMVQNLGKIAGRVLAVLMIPVAMAALVGSLTAHAIGISAEGLRVGQVETARGEGLKSTLADFTERSIQA